MSKEFDVSVVLPAYREQPNLEVLLPRIRTVMDASQKRYEVIVVDTPSAMDETPSVCWANQARYVNRAPGTCFGDAVRTGIREARGERILFMDADGSHAPEFIPHLLNRKDEDVLIASRYVEGGGTDNTTVLVWMSRFLNFTYAIVLDLDVKDVSNSFKNYSTAALQRLELSCDNFDIIEEILFKLKRNQPDLKIREIPYTFEKRLFGETKRNLFVFVLTYFFTMVRLRMSVFRKSPIGTVRSTSKNL